jgi:hypothetical protein
MGSFADVLFGTNINEAKQKVDFLLALCIYADHNTWQPKSTEPFLLFYFKHSKCARITIAGFLSLDSFRDAGIRIICYFSL